jgi:capsular polysaccharide biosynthesis protein
MPNLLCLGLRRAFHYNAGRTSTRERPFAMNLIDYGRLILRRGWLMLLLAIITAAAAFLFSQLITPVYRASQVVLIVPSRSDFGLTQAAVQLLNNRVAYLQSDTVAAAIIDELQLDMPPGFLRSRTTIAPNRDNLTIQIDVDLEAPDGESAARLIAPIAAAWGQQLIRYQNELNQQARQEDRIRAQVQDAPQMSLQRPNRTINTAIGAVGGFFLGAIIVFVLEYLESSIVRRREDLERLGGLRVLASVPEA